MSKAIQEKSIAWSIKGTIEGQMKNGRGKMSDAVSVEVVEESVVYVEFESGESFEITVERIN